MDVAILLFDDITALDAVGPYEVLWRIPGAKVTFVGREPGPIRTDNRALGLVAARSFSEVTHTDLLLIPGGVGTRTLIGDSEIKSWIKRLHGSTTWTTSVCTGSLLLAAAGVLDGVE